MKLVKFITANLDPGGEVILSGIFFIAVLSVMLLSLICILELRDTVRIHMMRKD